MSPLKFILSFSAILIATFAHAQTRQVLYGVTPMGGQFGSGVIFEYDLSTGSYTVKHHVFGGTFGGRPSYTLLKATDGNLYGFCQVDGSHADGVLYRFKTSNSSFTDLHDFDGGSDGGYPYGSLMQASNGILYGMTSAGGDGGGTLISYSLTNGFDAITFFDNNNGYQPWSTALIQATDGKLYGMTFSGGLNSAGVIFRTEPWSGITITNLFDFTFSTSGARPMGSLMQASDGKLYGMASSGAANVLGSLFQFDIPSSTFTKKIDFDGTAKGGSPKGSLIQASDGMLYGMTQTGGAYNGGTLFKYNPVTSAFTKVHDFATADGKNPQGSLMQASNGKLYGLTTSGGANNDGVLFEYNISSGAYTKKVDLEYDTKGGGPIGGLIEVTVAVGIEEYEFHSRFELYPNPGHGLVNITMAEQPANHVLEISNLLGEKIYTQPVTEKETVINTSKIPAGIYFVKVSDGEKFFVQKMLVE